MHGEGVTYVKQRKPNMASVRRVTKKIWATMHWNLVGWRPQKSQEKYEDVEGDEGGEGRGEERSRGRVSTVSVVYFTADMIY